MNARAIAISEIQEQLPVLADLDLLRLRARIAAELKRRGLASNIGQAAESLVIAFYNGTSGRPNLQLAPTGTQNVDALSRRGDRYSIKGVLDRRSWDSRMNAWYVSLAAKTLARSTLFAPG